MIRSAHRLLPALAGSAVQLLTGSSAPAQDSSISGLDGLNYFEAHVRPVLAEHCYECHSQKAEQANKLRASLHLDSRAGILKGGDNGKIVIPGQAEQSLLLKAIRYQVEDLEMPPKRKLSPRAIEGIAEWINLGAPLPDDGTRVKAPEPAFNFDIFRREHWAFQPVIKPSVPRVEEPAMGKHAIDAFVIRRMRESGVRQAPIADKRTLIRRAHFTLIGLPPTPAAVEAFLEDDSPDAFAAMVDQLLASPHYGERWGRHWLDVARYSDGMGASQDSKPLPNAWRYRDWVVNAFNKDLPYDRFVRDQIAGDLQDHESALGTGFFAIGPTYTSDGGDPESKAQAEAETLSDRVDTFSRAFLALTAACARCHDHKSDPITTADYYAIAGIFRNSRPREIPVSSQAVQDVYNTAQAAMKQQEKVINEFLERSAREAKVPRNEVEKKISESSRAELRALRDELESIRRAMPPSPAFAHGLSESGNGDMHIAIRGDLRKNGPIAPRKFLEVLGGAARPHFTDGSGRRQLAEAVADPENPLTARVMVNRVWLHHFGRALVRSPSNFGVNGQKPTHPLLLDWLTATFIEGGWSIKKLHRQIMLSRTWQQSSRYDEESFSRDGDNRFLWRMNPRRLDVEAWRDSLLAVSGDLDRKVGGSPDEHVLESRRRTIYGKLSRNFDRSVSEEFLRIFDFPAPRSSSAARTESTVPQQYLFILNSPFMIARAESLSKRLQESASHDDLRIDRAYSLLFQRAPTSRELQAGLAFLSQDGDRGFYWKQYAQVLLGTHEFMQVE